MQRAYRNRKCARPFSCKHALHITMRSLVAKGTRSLWHRPTRKWLDNYLPTVANRYAIRVYHRSNNGIHLHLVLQSTNRQSLQTFLRVIAGTIARRAMGAEKGRPSDTHYWTERPYSRIVSWGREYRRVIYYVERNAMEARKVLGYLERSFPLLPYLQREIEERVWLNARDRQESSREKSQQTFLPYLA